MWNRKQREIEELTISLRDSIITALDNRDVAQLLMQLAEGCTKHPSYRAVRKPTATCNGCANLFTIRRRLNFSARAEAVGYVVRSGKRGKKS